MILHASKRPGLRNIAEIANCSLMTVSRALNNAPNVSQVTKTRILKIAGEIGYRPDPKLTSLMGHLRQSRKRSQTETFAFVWPDATEKEIATSFWMRDLKQGAETRADALGIKLDFFFLAESKLTAPRLDRILYSRGIQSIVFGPVFHRAHRHLSMKWERYCVTSIGLGLWRPAFHRVHHDHFRSMLQLMRHLQHAGCRRVALLLPTELHRRMLKVYWAAFLALHPLSPTEAEKLTIFVEKEAGQEKSLRRKWKHTRADSIILAGRADVGMVLKELDIQSPTIGATLCWNPESEGFAGIDQQSSLLGAAAIDSAVAARNRSERGVPPQPQALLIEGKLIKPKSSKSSS